MDPITKTPKTQFSIRATIALTAAIAVWVWIFGDTKPIEMAVFTSVALAAGVVAHFVFVYLFPYRVTVIATVLLLYNSILIALALCASNPGEPLSDCLDLLVLVVAQPAATLMHARSVRGILFGLAIVLGTAVFTSAHPIRPSLPSALITALGIGIWYAAGILMLTYAA